MVLKCGFVWHQGSGNHDIHNTGGSYRIGDCHSASKSTHELDEDSICRLPIAILYLELAVTVRKSKHLKPATERTISYATPRFNQGTQSPTQSLSTGPVRRTAHRARQEARPAVWQLNNLVTQLLPHRQHIPGKVATHPTA